MKFVARYHPADLETGRSLRLVGGLISSDSLSEDRVSVLGNPSHDPAINPILQVSTVNYLASYLARLS